MRLKTGFAAGISIVIVVLCALRPSFAASTLSISPSGDGVFILQGLGVEGAAAMEISIEYDVQTLTDPRVVEGALISGALTAINPTVQGTVRMAAIRTSPITGSGVIATITFDRKGSVPGKILSMSARLANISGNALPAQVHIINPPEAIAGTATVPRKQGAATKASPHEPGFSAPAAIPPLMLATAPQVKSDDNTAPPETLLAKDREEPPAAPDITHVPGDAHDILAQKSDSPTFSKDKRSQTDTSDQKIYTHKSVLDRFKEYKGERTPQAFMALFEQDSLIGFRQEPPVALSDGKTIVRVSFITAPGNKTPADVAVLDAQLISLSKDPENTNTGIIKLLPGKGVYRASMSLSQGEMKMVYQLITAPEINLDLDKSGIVTEADFTLFLKKQETGNTQKFDLNNDKKRNFLDDYIFTANYLVVLERSKKKK